MHPWGAPLLGLLLVLMLFVGYGWVAKPDAPFLGAFRLALIAKQTAIVGVGALGMTVVVIAGGIDLSVGALLALCSVVLAQALAHGSGMALALLLALAAGLAGGFCNGLLVTRLRLVPFLATLATMLMFRGLAEQVAGQQKIPAQAPPWLAGLLDPPPPGGLQFVCGGVWILLLLAAALAWWLRRSVVGRWMFATGANLEAARLCGVPVRRVQMISYTLAGATAALAGLFEFVNLNQQGNPGSGLGLELEVIAAVVLGGASLTGGRGSIAGALLGALLMTTLRSGCVYAEVPDPMQKLLIGAIIAVAVARA